MFTLGLGHVDIEFTLIYTGAYMTIKDKIKQQISSISQNQKKFGASDLHSKIPETSRQYITEILKEMVVSGELLREGGGRYTTYTLPQYVDLLTNHVKKRLKNQDLDEDNILDDMKSGANFLNNLKDNVSRIFNYAFTEMVNNAISHSESENIEIEVYKSGNNLIFIVNDFGIGVFKNPFLTRVTIDTFFSFIPTIK